MEKITGRWIGEYIYGDNYDKPISGKSVGFVIDLVCDGELITGTFTDEETKTIFDEPGTIESSFEHETIVFYKSYPQSKDLVGEKLVLAKQYNSNSIQYTGRLKKKIFSKVWYFKGVWEINGSHLDENGNANYYSSDGTWKMKKA